MPHTVVDDPARCLALAVIARAVRDYRGKYGPNSRGFLAWWIMHEDGQFWCDLADLAPRSILVAMRKKKARRQAKPMRRSV